MKYPAHLKPFALASALALASAAQLSADTTWNNPASSTWNNAANWTPNLPTSADITFFNSASYLGGAITTTGAAPISGINVGSSSGALSLNTGGLSIGSGGIVSNSANAFTLNTTGTIAANQNWANNGAGSFTFGALAGSSTVTLTTGAFIKNATASTGASLTINGATLTTQSSTPIANTGLLTLTSGELNATGGRTYASSVLINGSFTLGDTTNNGAQGFTGVGATTKSITGNNTITLDGGAVTFTGNSLSLAAGSNTTFTGAASLSISTGFTLNGGTDTLTFNGAGTRTISGAFADTGTLVIAGSSTGITARGLSGAAGIRVDGSTVSFNTNAGVNLNTYSGGLTIQGGGTVKQTNANSFSPNSVVTIGESATNTGGTLDLTGLASTVSGLNSAGTSTSKFVTNSGATAALSLTGSGTYNYNGTIQNGVGSTGVTVNLGSGGIQTLSGSNSYTSATTITAGTLLITGTHTAGAGTYSVAAAGILGGDGLISAASLTTAAGSKISAGSAAGLAGNLKLTLTGAANLSASSNDTGAYIFDLGAVASSDKITLTTGTLNLGTLDFADFSFNTIAGFTSGTYILFDATSAITNTIGTASGTISGPFTGTISYDATNFDIILTVVPEPSSMVLLTVGLTAVTVFRRRRH